jgi:hypothetical protein
LYKIIIIIIIINENLEAVSGKHLIDSLQKTAILGTSHIIRKVVQCEACSLSGRDHRWFKSSTRKKRSVTRDDVNNNNNNNNNNIPIVIGATGIVTRSLKKNLEAVPGRKGL